MATAFTAPYCCLSLPKKSGSLSTEREHNVSRRPAVIGGLPLYLLRAMGHELRAARAKTLTETEPRSPAEKLRAVANAAATELDEREAEITALRTQCATLATALEFSNERLHGVSTNTAETVLAETASRFFSGMTAASCRASRAERELEVLQKELSQLQSKVRDKEGDVVQASAAAAALTLALLILWARGPLLGM